MNFTNNIVDKVIVAIVNDICSRKGLSHAWEDLSPEEHNEAKNEIRSIFREWQPDPSDSEGDCQYLCTKIADVFRSDQDFDQEWVDVDEEVVAEEIYPIWTEFLKGNFENANLVDSEESSNDCKKRIRNLEEEVEQLKKRVRYLENPL